MKINYPPSDLINGGLMIDLANSNYQHGENVKVIFWRGFTRHVITDFRVSKDANYLFLYTRYAFGKQNAFTK